jgi:flagellar protein FlaG
MLIQNITSSASAPTGSAGNGGPVGAAAQLPRTEASPPVAQQPTPALIGQEVRKINAALQQANKNLELSLSVDESTKKQVVKLTDKDTGDTLLQYPSETVLAIARGIDQFQNGLLLKREA